MSDYAIRADGVVVEYRPYTEARPTLRRSLATMRHRERKPVTALGGVSFEVARGEAFGIIGPNGAGKSTLLRVLAGTLLPDAGSVSMSGRASTLLQLGVGFNPELTGRRNIYLGCLAGGLSKAQVDPIVDDVIAYAELEDAIDRPLKTFSSGMFSRLAFAVGMAMEPEILLLDEVLSVGDEAFRRKSMRAMTELLGRAGTIVFVSHALQSVADFCDRVLWLEKGKVRALGNARDVVDEYIHGVDDDEDASTKPKVNHWVPKRKLGVVLRVLGGEDLLAVAGENDLPPAHLEIWRDSFIERGKEGLSQKAIDRHVGKRRMLAMGEDDQAASDR